jgi:ribosomal protein S6--L-glutamate ligase
MRLGVLGNSESWYVADLQRVAKLRGHICERLEFPRLIGAAGGSLTTSQYAGENLLDYDAVIVRTMPPGSLEQVVFRMDLLHQLVEGGVLVLNPPRALECAVDKYLTTAKLARVGLPVPETIVCECFEEAMEAFQTLGGDVVVKPLFGSEGRGIVRVSDPDLAHRVFRTLERIDSVLYLQRFVRHPGYDIRVLILGGKVLGGMKRISTTDFRTNVSRDAHTEIHAPTVTEIDYAQRAVVCTGSTFAGVDLLYDEHGQLFVIEVNAVPGWRAFARTTGIDVANEVMQWIEAHHGQHA